MINKVYIQGVGKKKTSIARIFIKKGIGNILINSIAFSICIKKNFLMESIQHPLYITKMYKKLDLLIFVNGGGIKSQIDAIKLGISKTLVKINENFKKQLKIYKLITRDSRKVERKKIGRIKARKKRQFSKR